MTCRANTRILAEGRSLLDDTEQRPPADVRNRSRRPGNWHRATSCRRSWSAAPDARSAPGWRRPTARARRPCRSTAAAPRCASDSRRTASRRDRHTTIASSGARSTSSLRASAASPIAAPQHERPPARSAATVAVDQVERQPEGDDHEQRGRRLRHHEAVVHPQVRIDRGERGGHDARPPTADATGEQSDADDHRHPDHASSPPAATGPGRPANSPAPRAVV